MAKFPIYNKEFEKTCRKEFCVNYGRQFLTKSSCYVFPLIYDHMNGNGNISEGTNRDIEIVTCEIFETFSKHSLDFVKNQFLALCDSDVDPFQAVLSQDSVKGHTFIQEAKIFFNPDYKIQLLHNAGWFYGSIFDSILKRHPRHFSYYRAKVFCLDEEIIEDNVILTVLNAYLGYIRNIESNLEKRKKKALELISKECPQLDK